MNSSIANSFSSSPSTATTKNRLAYRRYTTLYPRYSINEHWNSVRDKHLRIIYIICGISFNDNDNDNDNFNDNVNDNNDNNDGIYTSASNVTRS